MTGRGKIVLVLATLLVTAALLTAQRTDGPAPTKADAERFVRELDNLFNSQNRASYFARFETEGRPCFDSELHHRIENLSILGIRSSSTVDAFSARGDIGVALVTTRYSHNKGALTVSTFTAFKQRDNQAVGLFSIEVDPTRAANIDKNSELFKCPACNYEVRFSKDWLAVPVLPSRSGCMEALWLVSLKHNIYLEAAVHVGETAVEAPEALAACVQTTRAHRQILDTTAPEFTDWRPTAFATAPMPAGMSSIRCVRHCEQSMVAEMNLIVMGRLRYLMVVRGSKADIEHQRQDIDKILKSFRLLQPSLTAQAMAKRSTFAHTGAGTFDSGNTYTNKKYGLAITGPKGWTTTVRPGGWLFQIIFSCPTSAARLSIRAIRPVGTKWTRFAANRVIQNALTNTNRRKVDVTKWHQATTSGGFEWIELRTVLPPDKNCDHVVRYAIRPDILLIMDGNIPLATAAESVRKAMDSLVIVQ